MGLAVKYRPNSFEDVVEQNITITILQRIIKTRNFKNCYLFAGSSGCGKTTCARIFANAINNGIGSPIEVDGASNNGVDNIRAIIESANQRALCGEYKVFIIDECHMITSAGWNAFLKGIEEPPKYTIFIFCTTEPQKLPATILNRVQRYNFSKISAEGIKARLEYICQAEGFTNYIETCDFISHRVNGGMREAISYLDQIADYSTDLNLQVAKQILGGLSYENMFKLTWAIQKKSAEDILQIIDSLYAEGTDLKQFIDLYLSFVLDLAKYILFKNISFTNIPSYLASGDNAVVQYTVESNDVNYFTSLATHLLEVKSAMRFDTNYKNTVEVMLLNLLK